MRAALYAIVACDCKGEEGGLVLVTGTGNPSSNWPVGCQCLRSLLLWLLYRELLEYQHYKYGQPLVAKGNRGTDTTPA